MSLPRTVADVIASHGDGNRDAASIDRAEKLAAYSFRSSRGQTLSGAARGQGRKQGRS